MAETEGFEPSVREYPVRRFSKPLVSATHPRLRSGSEPALYRALGGVSTDRVSAPQSLSEEEIIGAEELRMMKVGRGRGQVLDRVVRGEVEGNRRDLMPERRLAWRRHRVDDIEIVAGEQGSRSQLRELHLGSTPASVSVI